MGSSWSDSNSPCGSTSRRDSNPSRSWNPSKSWNPSTKWSDSNPSCDSDPSPPFNPTYRASNPSSSASIIHSNPRKLNKTFISKKVVIHNNVRPSTWVRQPIEPKIVVPKHILENPKVVDPETIRKINEFVGKNWKKLARVLNISEVKIQDIEHMYHMYGYGEYCYQSILKWKEQNGNEATVGKLAQALVNADLSMLALDLQD